MEFFKELIRKFFEFVSKILSKFSSEKAVHQIINPLGADKSSYIAIDMEEYRADEPFIVTRLLQYAPEEFTNPFVVYVGKRPDTTPLPGDNLPMRVKRAPRWDRIRIMMNPADQPNEVALAIAFRMHYAGRVKKDVLAALEEPQPQFIHDFLPGNWFPALNSESEFTGEVTKLWDTDANGEFDLDEVEGARVHSRLFSDRDKQGWHRRFLWINIIDDHMRIYLGEKVPYNSIKHAKRGNEGKNELTRRYCIQS